MIKLYLKDNYDWLDLIKNLGEFSGIDENQTPAHYPCFIIYFTRQLKNSNYDETFHEFVYKSEF